MEGSEFPGSPEAGLSEEDLRAIAARCEAATPGPWRHSHSGNVPEPVVVSLTVNNRRGGPMIVASTRWPLASLGAGDQAAEANAQFVAEARQDVPRLLAEVSRLKQRLEAAAGGAQGVDRTAYREGAHLTDP